MKASTLPISRNRTVLAALVFALLPLLGACQTAVVGGPNAPGSNVAPSAVASATPTRGSAPLTVAFDASGSSDPDGVIVAYDWDFGDDSSGSGTTAQHTYQEGSYTATLTVTDSDGASATRTLEIDATGSGGPPPPTPPTDPGPPPAAGPTAEQIAAGVTASGEAAALQEEASVSAIDAAVTATQLSGSQQLVTTGTLTIDPAAPLGATYDPQPSDRLRIVAQNGSSVEFTFSAFDGDFDAPSIDEFLRRPHTLVFRLVTSDGSDVEIASARTGSSSGGDVGGLVRGTVVVEGASYDVDLLSQGTFTATAGSSVDYESTDVLQGSVTGPDTSVTVNEERYFRWFQFENAIELRRRTIDNSWTVDGVAYRIADGVIKRNFTCPDGGICGPDELDLWIVQGTLTADGAAIGGIGLLETAFTFDTVLQVGDEQIVLYSDNKVVN